MHFALSLIRLRVAGWLMVVLLILVASGASVQATEAYHHYFGNTHSHTVCSDGSGTAAESFALAKSTGLNFYAVTDHALAKYAGFTAASYEETKHQADVYTDAGFVGIAGFEFSENDGPNGTGHCNVLNSAGYLDATGSSVSLPTLYDWLVNNQRTTVAASFNHAGTTSHNSFGYLTTARRNPMSMFEVINSGNLHYSGFIEALKKSWRVAPIAALDNHGPWRITNHFYRTGVLATSLTREAILDAMRARRVYCTWDKNLRLTLTANGSIMGSVLSKPSALAFCVGVADPDTGSANDRITRIEIVGENDVVVASSSFLSHAVTWNVARTPQYKYYYAKVYAADKTDGPTAYSAPIWIDNTSLMTIRAAKTAPDGSTVDITSGVIIAAWSGFFYIESEDRTHGIRVNKAAHGLSAGTRADIVGAMATSADSERYIQASAVSLSGSGTIKPVHMGSRHIGGVSSVGQIGVKDGLGPNNIGLLIRTCGRVSYVDPAGGLVYLDDGSGRYDGNSSNAKGVRVITTGMQQPQLGTYTTITGISTIVTVGASKVRAVRMTGCDSVQANAGFRVEGNRLILDGEPFVPLGFTMVGLLSPTMTGTAGTAGQHYGQAELDAAKSWGANTMRFQISQRGFDPTDSLHTDSYVQRVKDGVALARGNGFAVILSMQDQSYSGGDATEMPEPQTLRAWPEVASHFNGDPGIIYEVFNEPKVKDTAADWQLWLSGGTYNGVTVIGHQQLVDTIRATGATNVLIVEGTRVGKSFIGFPGISDPLSQLAFGIHPYLNSPILDPTKWDSYFGNFSQTHVVIATEWSATSNSNFCESTWPTVSPQLLAYLKSHNIGVMPWAFDITGTLIKDWNWTPTSFAGFTCGTTGAGPGELVKQHFASYSAAP